MPSTRLQGGRRSNKSGAPRTPRASRDEVAAAPSPPPPPLASRHPHPRATPWRRRAVPRRPRKPTRRRGSRCRALAPSRAGAAVASCPGYMGIGEICTCAELWSRGVAESACCRGCKTFLPGAPVRRDEVEAVSKGGKDGENLCLQRKFLGTPKLLGSRAEV